MLSKKASLQSQLGLFDYQMSEQPLKNVVSMLIKDKDITSYQLLLIKQDRVLVLASLTSFFDYTVVNLEFFFVFFHFSKKMGRSGDGKRNILLGWPLCNPTKKINSNMVILIYRNINYLITLHNCLRPRDSVLISLMSGSHFKITA